MHHHRGIEASPHCTGAWCTVRSALRSLLILRGLGVVPTAASCKTDWSLRLRTLIPTVPDFAKCFYHSIWISTTLLLGLQKESSRSHAPFMQKVGLLLKSRSKFVAVACRHTTTLLTLLGACCWNTAESWGCREIWGSNQHSNSQAAAEISTNRVYQQSHKAVHHFGQQFSCGEDFDHSRCQLRVAFHVNVLFKKCATLTGQESKPWLWKHIWISLRSFQYTKLHFTFYLNQGTVEPKKRFGELCPFPAERREEHLNS